MRIIKFSFGTECPKKICFRFFVFAKENTSRLEVARGGRISLAQKYLVHLVRKEKKMKPFVYIARTYWQGIKSAQQKSDKLIYDKIDYNAGLLTKRKLTTRCVISHFLY